MKNSRRTAGSTILALLFPPLCFSPAYRLNPLSFIPAISTFHLLTGSILSFLFPPLCFSPADGLNPSSFVPAISLFHHLRVLSPLFCSRHLSLPPSMGSILPLLFPPSLISNICRLYPLSTHEKDH